jgi:hypothetical protein
MEAELANRSLGYSEAVGATLDLLVISAAQMSSRQTAHRSDPLVTHALQIVDERFREPPRWPDAEWGWCQIVRTLHGSEQSSD